MNPHSRVGAAVFLPDPAGYTVLFDRDNGSLSFSIWSYGEYHYFDEFDPQYLHLGRALGPYEKRGQCHFREFEDGWVAVNGTATDLTDVAVPRGSARILAHGNLRTSTTAPLVGTFGLAAHRGVVLLKDGRQAGNADNPMPPAGQPAPDPGQPPR